MRSILWIGLLLCSTSYIDAQSEVTFGKNRVQYDGEKWVWNQYQSDNFTAYFYGEARQTAQAAIQMAEMDFQEIKALVEHQLSERIELIVYTDLTDFNQSNLGIEEAFTSQAGKTKVIGNKMFVYYNGSHEDLYHQVREGVAGVFLNSLYFGSDLKDIVQNVISSDIPEWFFDGLSAYIGKEWSHEMDEFLRSKLGTRLYRDFNDVIYEAPRLGGQSFWYFIVETYGSSAVSNLLYLTRINRNLETAFLYVLGVPLKEVEAQWLDYYTKRYNLDRRTLPKDKDDDSLPIKVKKRVDVTHVSIHPSGTMIAYVENDINKTRTIIYDLLNDEKTIVLKHGFRNAIQATDSEYPHIAWNPNGLSLSMLYEKYDQIHYLEYDLASEETTETILNSQYDRVHSIDFRNSFQLVLSATVNGQSDIFLFNTKSQATQRLTDDYFDDRDARWVKLGDKEGILFSSNRQDNRLDRRRLDTILPINPMDIHFLQFIGDEKGLTQITFTPFISEYAPQAIDSLNYTYIDDNNGIRNRYKGYLEEVLDSYEMTVWLASGEKIVGNRDSLMIKLDQWEVDSTAVQPIYRLVAHNQPISDGHQSILVQAAAVNRSNIIETKKYDTRIKFNQVRLDSTASTDPLNTVYKQSLIQKLQIADRTSAGDVLNLDRILGNAKFEIQDTLEQFYAVVKTDTVYPIPRDYLFQSPWPDPVSKTSAAKIVKDTIYIPITNQSSSSDELPLRFRHPKVAPFRRSRIIAYRTKMRTDYVTAKADNSLLFEGLETYTGPGQEFRAAPTGFLIKANTKDILEDYQLEVGVRIPFDFSGTEYFVTGVNNKKRLDKTVSFYRRSIKRQSLGDDSRREEYNVLLGQFGVRYPLDVFRSFRGRFTLRNDRTTPLATDLETLNSSNDNVQRTGLRAEYVFDNTLEYAANILNGTRYKFYAEIQKAFDIETQNGLKVDARQGTLAVLGVDARHYIRLARHSIFAVRGAAATSFGSDKILYYLGGTDNWLLPQFSDQISQPAQGSDFAFQALAGNMRGFDRNIRNGNSYALINAELRIPIFRYFSKRVKSSFFKNFQVVGFADVGTAWQGASPFSEDNPVNTFTVSAPPLISVDVRSFREPIVGGIGAGARMLLFGYFIRLDYAWGIENNVFQDPKLYVSLGYDF